MISGNRLGVWEKIYVEIYFPFWRDTEQFIKKDIGKLIDNENRLKRENLEGDIPNHH